MFPEPIFADRADAGRQLAALLADFANRPNAIVLGIPRGGVVVAAVIAQALNLPLDIFLSHKLGVPGHEELAFGAIAANGNRYLDSGAIRHAQISPETIERVTAEVAQLLDQRARLYRGDRPPLTLANRTVLLADDGIATGASAFAALQALRQSNPAEIILAVPVAPASTAAWLRRFVERLVCLHAPNDFYAVGQFFQSFAQLHDEEIIDLLNSPRQST